MKRIEITQALLASLEFEPFELTAPKESVVNYVALQKILFVPGNVLKLGNRRRHGGQLDQYILVGHINDEGGYCDDCSIKYEQIEAIAHISQLFPAPQNIEITIKYIPRCECGALMDPDPNGEHDGERDWTCQACGRTRRVASKI